MTWASQDSCCVNGFFSHTQGIKVIIKALKTVSRWALNNLIHFCEKVEGIVDVAKGQGTSVMSLASQDSCCVKDYN